MTIQLPGRGEIRVTRIPKSTDYQASFHDAEGREVASAGGQDAAAALGPIFEACERGASV